MDWETGDEADQPDCARQCFAVAEKTFSRNRDRSAKTPADAHALRGSGKFQNCSPEQIEKKYRRFSVCVETQSWMNGRQRLQKAEERTRANAGGIAVRVNLETVLAEW